MYWLSVCAPNLITLDLRDCPGIDLTQGLAQCHSSCMKNLQHVYLGPSNYLITDPPLFVELLQGHLIHLETLHLDSLGGLDDLLLAELLSVSTCLEEVALVNMQFGTSTIEALCSYVPNLARVTLIGTIIYHQLSSSILIGPLF